MSIRLHHERKKVAEIKLAGTLEAHQGFIRATDQPQVNVLGSSCSREAQFQHYAALTTKASP